jgi:hypothetical protein
MYGVLLITIFFCRDSFGGSAVIGDKRWTGTFGVNLDIVARTHCSVEFIKTEDILVTPSLKRFFEKRK